MSLFSGAHFIASAHDSRELPPDVGVEIAFAGRSNAGKSSAINAITHRNRLAFVSKTPGRTQTINFFACGASRRLVDLPGYGYAAVPQRERAYWGVLVSTYLEQRRSLRGLVLLADARRGLGLLDEQLLKWHAPSGQPVLVLLTKSDKLKREPAAHALQRTQALLASRYPAATAQLFSAVSGAGLRVAQGLLHGWLK
jgi:GTP-binding protein